MWSRSEKFFSKDFKSEKIIVHGHTPEENIVNDPYRIKVTNGSGLAGVLGSAFDVNLPPAFVNSADTNLTNVVNSGPAISGSTANASATDADGDTITYSIVSGSLPTGLSLGS